MRFSIVNLGCKVNRVESDGFEQQLVDKGWSPTSLADADLVLINTCTVTAEADKKTRKAVRQVLHGNDHAQIWVTGCAAAIHPDTFEAMDSRVQVVSKVEVPQRIHEMPSEPSLAPRDSQRSHAEPFCSESRVRRGVKIQDGCDHACTYCIVHVARGRSVSVDPRLIEDEVRTLLDHAVPELVLTGINLGSYQWDGMDLTVLLRRILAVADSSADYCDPCRIRLSSIEPMDVSDGLIDLLASQSGRLCRHLHIPLQSGSSRVLRAMDRPYDADGFLDLVATIRRQVPDISLSTDIIVGFPGETESDFQATLDVARQCAFSRIHVFPYSAREDTPAAARPDQVDPLLRKDRAARLRALAAQLKQEDYRRRAGTIESVVVEEPGIGRTESYHAIEVDDALSPGFMGDMVLPCRCLPV